MDDNWLAQLDKSTVLVVPTRSLVTSLNERLARHYLASNTAVWEAPAILVWSDYLRALWQANRHDFAASEGALSLISAQQSLLVWTQIIEQSRRNEQALTLLNVQQTARAVQRSWRLMHEWLVPAEAIKQDHVADTEQFLYWLDEYRQKLSRRGLIDESMLSDALSRVECELPYTRMIWVSYDLITDAQQRHIASAQDRGVEVLFKRPQQVCQNQKFQQFTDPREEIKAALETARKRLEADPKTQISIVVPDLEHRQASIEELARAVFYPNLSPLQIQQNSNVYRFSLGQYLHEWPAIETALGLLALLKNRVSIGDLSYLLRNQFIDVSVAHRDECRIFERWLKHQRFHQVLFDQLPDLYAECKAALSPKSLPASDSLETRLRELSEHRLRIQSMLKERAEESAYAALGFSAWATVFTDWLGAWGWHTNTVDQAMNSVQYQLHKRWVALLEEFSGLSTVQHRAGLARVLELVQQMARNTVFLPKSAASPIVISGVLEAVGREVDLCILTGMHQDYPPAPKADAFIPSRLLAESGHPAGGTRNGSQHAFKVIDHLLECASQQIVSYARRGEQDSDIELTAATLFRDAEFVPHHKQVNTLAADEMITLETYCDTQGLPWSANTAPKGGSRIFENQSQCAFKAYATHQLACAAQDDAEFGLDNLDRGNVVHHLLDKLWGRLQTQAALRQQSEPQRVELIETLITQTLEDNPLQLSHEKRHLLRLEAPRLQRLLGDWLALEEQRPEAFTVIERERQGRGSIGGIAFDFIVDRVDLTNDGRSVIIDYKTGAVNRNGWTGERLRSPQMPLYALALDAENESPASGIAFASVRQGDHKFVELSEAGIFRKAQKRQQDCELEWQENRAAWPTLLAQLAGEFLDGRADVDPIDDDICKFCDLGAMCRVSQFRLAAGAVLGDEHD